MLRVGMLFPGNNNFLSNLPMDPSKMRQKICLSLILLNGDYMESYDLVEQFGNV